MKMWFGSKKIGDMKEGRSVNLLKEEEVLGKRMAEEAEVIDQESFRRILVGIDLSEQARSVLRLSSSLVHVFDSDVIVCTVVMLNTSVVGNESDGYPANEKEFAINKYLTELVTQEIGRTANSINVKILHGAPAARIVEYADYSNCNLIIIGSRRASALKKLFTGSVSGAVVQKSKKPVFVVKY